MAEPAHPTRAWRRAGHETRRAQHDAAALLDPRAPLVLDTRELGRRPGSMRRVTRTVPAPEALAIEVVGVPEGCDVDLTLRLEAVMEGVLVSGTATTRTAGECVRCLEPVGDDLEVELQELYLYPGGRPAAEDDEDELREMQGDLIDLEPALRDAVVLALPLRPVCDEDCPGLCVECGQRLAEDPGHTHEAADPRWAALEGLLRTADEAPARHTAPDVTPTTTSNITQER